MQTLDYNVMPDIVKRCSDDEIVNIYSHDLTLVTISIELPAPDRESVSSSKFNS